MADEIQAFHVINRCVRHMYLCGQERRSVKDYWHRNAWIQERLEELARIFGLDIPGFAVMTNDFHLLLWPHEERDLSRWVQRLLDAPGDVEREMAELQANGRPCGVGGGTGCVRAAAG